MRFVLALVLLVGSTSVSACSLFEDERAEPPPAPGEISATSMVHEEKPTTTAATTTTVPASSRVSAEQAKVDFLARATEICDVMNRGTAELNQRYPDGTQPTPEQLAEGVTSTLKLSETAVRDMRTLPQPPGEELMLGRLYAEVDEINVLLGRLAEALTRRDAMAVATVTSELEPKAQSTNQHFIDYGLITCGQGNSGDQTTT